MKRFPKKDLTTEDRLLKHITSLTHSGLLSLDPELLKEIKSICKNSPPLVQVAYNAIMKQLRTDHCEVRLIAFQLCIELFKRSHNFRLLAIQNLECMLELTAGIEPTKKMPPPKNVAEKLKELALVTVMDWKDSFGNSYKLLLNGYDYLVRVRRVDFESVRRRIEEREQVLLERNRRDEEIKQQVLGELTKDVDDHSNEFESMIETITNCISLLLPTPDDFFVASSDSADDASLAETVHDTPTQTAEVAKRIIDSDDDEPNMRLFGITHSYNLIINVNHNNKINVERNAENSAVIDTLKESLKLHKIRVLPCIRKWDIGVGNLCLKPDHELVARINSLKSRLEKCIQKSKGLRIDGGQESSDEESDMEEVVKEGYEPAVMPILVDPHPFYSSTIVKAGPSGVPAPSKIQPQNSLEDVEKNEQPLQCESDSRVKSTETDDITEKSLLEESNKSRKERLLAIAPKLPYDVDLYHWEDQKLSAPTVVSVKVNKWGSGDMEVDEVEMPGGSAALRTRVIEFTGKFEPVTRSCRAPLPTGGLCPRMDRHKCPFHGRIVPRNDKGECLNPEDNDVVPSTSESKPAVPDWQDPVLLAQLKAATGIDLKMPEKGKKRKRGKKGQPNADVLDDIKRRNFPGLTDLSRSKNNPKVRLKKKLFNRSAMRRVAEAVNKIERGRHRDKFGDQFNYQ